MDQFPCGIQAGDDTHNGVLVPSNKVGALLQKNPFGVSGNLAAFDDTDTCSWGETQGDAHRVQNVFYGPLNYVKRHLHLDFNANLGSVLPPELALSGIGSGLSVAYQSPSRVKLSTAGSGVGSGGLVTLSNMSLNSDAETQLHFCMNLSASRNVDLQFGLREKISGADQLRFRYAAPSSAYDQLVCTGQSGANSNTVSTGWNAVTQRRLFCLRLHRGGDVTFWAADSNNVLQLVATFPNGANYIPGASLDLVPFIQLRTYDTAAVISLLLDAIYLITEW